jgi:hypothetical protein
MALGHAAQMAVAAGVRRFVFRGWWLSMGRNAHKTMDCSSFPVEPYLAVALVVCSVWPGEALIALMGENDLI